MPLGTQPISPMLITIVIATYNAADTLTRCLHSIAPQKAEGVELLVVDGGSTDGTAEMAMKSPVVDKVVSEPDRGVYDAWNKGVAMAGGEWVMFMGADDELLPGAIDTWMEMLRQLPAGTTCEYICGYNEFADDSGKLLRKERYSGAMQRSFYVGEGIDENDVKAKFEDGVLRLTFPKEKEPELPEKTTIMIEG